MHNTSQTWSDSLTSVNGRMGSTQKKRGGLFWYTDGSKTNREPGAGGLVGVQEEGIASALGSVPPYSRLQYTRAVQWKTGKVVLKIACKTDVIVCRVCEGSDIELPIDGVGTHRNLGNSSTRWRCPCNSAPSKSSEVL